MRFENPFSKKKETTEAHERLLPSDVRYALQYKEAKLNTPEILDLVENGFEYEALYLLLKGAVNEPKLQQALLQETVDTLLSSEAKEGGEYLRPFLRSALTQLEEGTTVEAQKIAMLSRQGIEMWHNLYTEKAKELASTDSSVYLLGHATFVGLPAFIQAFASEGKTLNALIPDFFENEELSICGYSIQNGVVSFLPKEFERQSSSVLVDDVRHTGASVEEALSFWSQKGESSPDVVVLLESGKAV